MKLYLVNVNNCINYTQYGPFFFEKIKSGELVVFNDAADISQLDKVCDDLLERFNRNAYRTEEVKLVILLPRSIADGVGGCDYEVYNNINIYMKITRKVPMLSEVITLYVDDKLQTQSDRIYREMEKVNESFVSDLPELKGVFIPGSIEKEADFEQNFREIMLRAAKGLSDPVTSEFFGDVIENLMPRKMEDDAAKKQILKFFAVKCGEMLPDITQKRETVRRTDISDSINKRLKIVSFINALVEGKVSSDEYDSFEPDYGRIKNAVKTYMLHLEEWLGGEFDGVYAIDQSLYSFIRLAFVGEFERSVDDIIATRLPAIKRTNAQDAAAISEMMELLSQVVRDAETEMTKLANKDTKHFFDPESYEKVELDKDAYSDEIDAEKHENELLEKLNQFRKVTMPGFAEKLQLEQKLENASKKIKELLRAKRAYSLKALFGTFLFAALGVAVLYLAAQMSVFVKENTFSIYAAYSAFVAAAFLAAAMSMGGNCTKKIKDILARCRDEVEEFLISYKVMAREFEENLNAMADYYCFKDYLLRKKAVESRRKEDLKKYSWHKKRVREVLDNMRHFNDFIDDAQYDGEIKKVPFDNYDHDAEHTNFYHMRKNKEGE